MLGIDPPQLTASKLAELKSKIEGNRERLSISDRHLDNIRSLITSYVKGTRDKDTGETVSQIECLPAIFSLGQTRLNQVNH